MQKLNKEILTFLIFVAAFSSLPDYLMIHTGHIEAYDGWAVRAVMWCPALAAFAASLLFRLKISSLGWRIRTSETLAWGYFLPVLYALPVYLACWLFVTGSFTSRNFSATFSRLFHMANPGAATTLGILALATLGILLSLLNATGEEIGWRGFLLPRLTRRFGFTTGCLVSGIIWAVWHYPGLLWSDYNAGTNPAYALLCFTLMVIPMAFILGWLRLKSRSLWPCALLHASHNLFVQAVFDAFTSNTGRAKYITTEFGFGLALTIAAAAFFFWRRRAELPHPATA